MSIVITIGRTNKSPFKNHFFMRSKEVPSFRDLKIINLNLNNLKKN